MVVMLMIVKIIRTKVMIVMVDNVVDMTGMDCVEVWVLLLYDDDETKIIMTRTAF